MTRPSRDRKAKEEAAAVAEAPPPPASPEQAIANYKTEMSASIADLETTLAEEGGRRGLIPPVPTPQQVAARDAKLAAAKPREPTDEELGLGERGIPERRVRGLGAAWNFTMGPVLLYSGPQDLARIHALADPHIVVAKYIPEMDLKKMDRTRVRGFVIEKGSIVDPTYWFFRDENRACVIGAEDAFELALEGESAVVDGVRGVAYFGPDAGTLKDYEYLRSIGPPTDDPLLREATRHLASAVMGTKLKNRETLPYDFPDQDRLIRVAKATRAGEPVSAEDDAWMKDIILMGMPSLEDMQASGKKPKEIEGGDEMPLTAARKKEQGEKEDAEAGAKDAKDAKEEGKKDARGRPIAERKSDEKRADEKTADETKDDAKAEKAGKKDDAKPGAEEKKETAEDKASARKAAREAEMAAAQAARSKAKELDKPKAEAPKEEAPKAAEPGKTETAEDRAAARKAARDAEIAAAQAARSKGKKDEKS